MNLVVRNVGKCGMTVDDLVTSHRYLLDLLRTSKALVDQMEKTRAHGSGFTEEFENHRRMVRMAQKHVDEKW